MPYTVRSSESLRKTASESETKALLYLMNFRDDSDEVFYFVVDFFNDLTGMDRMSHKLWDIQSKGAANSSPKTIGRELVTLYKNYCSDFYFTYYILFLGGVSSTFRKDSSITTFNIDNVRPSALSKLKNGLIEECNTKSYIDNSLINEDTINAFLENVFFVIDNKNPSEYVKSILKIQPSIIPDDMILTAIFNEIRDKQASKKNICSVEGITIETTDQALNYYHHLTTEEIKLLVLSRIINRNPFDKGCPTPFIPIYNNFPPEKQQDALDDCRIALARAIFNKNSTENFWALLGDVHKIIISNPKYDVESIFRGLNDEIVSRCPDFNTLSLKYFISIVKEGIG